MMWWKKNEEGMSEIGREFTHGRWIGRHNNDDAEYKRGYVDGIQKVHEYLARVTGTSNDTGNGTESGP